jgi:hypothetical protein
MLLWMMDAVERDAQLLLESMKGIGKNDTALLGILCSRTPSQLQLISQTYFKTYHKSLESQIEGDTSGDYRKVSDCHVWKIICRSQRHFYMFIRFKGACLLALKLYLLCQVLATIAAKQKIGL